MNQQEQINYQLKLIAQQRIKDIKGFYTHLFATFLILPFLIFINLQTVPQFEWYWYAITAWCLGLLIHWLNVFPFSKLGFKKEWEDKKLKEIIANSSVENEINLNDTFIQEKYYLKAKKQAEEIKGFYIHLIVTVFTIPIIVFVNLKFVPQFHFFWFAIGGMCIAIFLHWLGVFGFNFLGLGKNWEERKTKEIITNFK